MPVRAPKVSMAKAMTMRMAAQRRATPAVHWRAACRCVLAKARRMRIGSPVLEAERDEGVERGREIPLRDGGGRDVAEREGEAGRAPDDEGDERGDLGEIPAGDFLLAVGGEGFHAISRWIMSATIFPLSRTSGMPPPGCVVPPAKKTVRVPGARRGGRKSEARMECEAQP